MDPKLYSKIVSRKTLPIILLAVFFVLAYFYSDWFLVPEPVEGQKMNQIIKEAFDKLRQQKSVDKAIDADLDKNQNLENYSLHNGKLKISTNNNLLWQSPDTWWVDDFVLSDSTNDGVTDINLSVWKSGSFGKLKPFWVKENDASVKNHFFVFDLRQGKIQPVWQSSNLEKPNCKIEVADIDHSGKNSLVVMEGDYMQDFSCQGKNRAVWQWNGWGFSNVWRSTEGDTDGRK